MKFGFLTRKERAVPESQPVVMLLPPDKIKRIIPRNTRLSFLVWYIAIYEVHHNPDIRSTSP